MWHVNLKRTQIIDSLQSRSFIHRNLSIKGLDFTVLFFHAHFHWRTMLQVWVCRGWNPQITTPRTLPPLGLTRMMPSTCMNVESGYSYELRQL